MSKTSTNNHPPKDSGKFRAQKFCKKKKKSLERKKYNFKDRRKEKYKSKE